MSKPNILFILIDGLRADKFYNTKKSSITPNFEKYISQGTYFEQTISSSDATLLSWAGMFTGKHPFKTGIRSTKFKKLNKNIQTYFEIFTNEGYDFYAFLPPSGKVIGIFPEFKNTDCYEARPIFKKGVDEKIKNFLLSEKKQPWFCYIHSYNLHFPVQKPEGFEDEKFGINNYEKQISLIDHSIGDIMKLVDLSNTIVIFTADHGQYFQTVVNDGKKISYENKGNVQKISLKMTNKVPKSLHSLRTKSFVALEKIKKKKRLHDINNLNLKPHELRGLLHQRSNPDKFLYDDLLHVPLLLLGNKIPNKKIISQQVCLIDLLPTICDLLKIPNPSNIDGVSLVPLMNEEKLEESPAFFESTPFLQMKSNDVIGVRTSKFKYFRDKFDSNKRVHLFDLESDPNEDNNIATNKTLVDEMEKILGKILKNYSFLPDGQTVRSQEKEETEKIEEILKKLGYV